MKKLKSLGQTGIQHFTDSGICVKNDQVCIEEPLEFRLSFYTTSGDVEFKTLTIIMRSPGMDTELVTGFLYCEGIITHADDIQKIQYAEERGSAGYQNSLEVHLKNPLLAENQQLERHFTTYSSCGLCGKTSIASLELQNPPILSTQEAILEPLVLNGLSAKMLKAQTLFEYTGFAHASGLFTPSGTLIKVCEDIGRHNALDKLIGFMLNREPKQLSQSILIVSGRASFELVQKAVMAGIPILASVGAPSSLAIATAQRFNLTLIGFLRGGSFNVYNAAWRLKMSEED